MNHILVAPIEPRLFKIAHFAPRPMPMAGFSRLSLPNTCTPPDCPKCFRAATMPVSASGFVAGSMENPAPRAAVAPLGAPEVSLLFSCKSRGLAAGEHGG